MYVNGNVSLASDIKTCLVDTEEKVEQVVTNLSSLGEAHVELLAEEISIQKNRIIKGIAFAAAGSIAAIFAALFISMCAVYVLVQFTQLSLGTGLATLGVFWLLLCAVFIAIGFSALKKVQLLPEATIKSLKDTFLWLRH